MVVIANPRAGHGRGARVLSQVEAHLADRNIVHRTVVSARPGHVTEIAAEAAGRGESPLVLVGGDGTLFEALNGMVKAGRFVPVAQIPVGTGNSFIKDLGIESVEDGLRALTAGRTRAVDIGRVRSPAGEFHFVNLVGAGFVANVGSRANAFKLFGDLSYKIGVMVELIGLKALPCRLDRGREGERPRGDFRRGVQLAEDRRRDDHGPVRGGRRRQVRRRGRPRDEPRDPPEALPPHLHRAST